MSDPHGFDGTDTIRHIIQERPFELMAGSLVLIPVVNILAFEQLTRYSPDRRDLNRSYPGTKRGSLTSRPANTIFQNIVARCDYGIDLHTAAVTRTNYPNSRADMDQESTARLATLFGAELIINSPGPVGSLRRSAVKAGCLTGRLRHPSSKSVAVRLPITASNARDHLFRVRVVRVQLK